MGTELGVVGVGRFGRALLGGLLKSNTCSAKELWAVDHVETALAAARSHFETLLPTASRGDLRLGLDPRDFLSRHTQILLLAVKPHQISDVISNLKSILLEALSELEIANLLVISVAAGTSLQKLETDFQLPVKIVRAMSNSPALIQEGMTSLAKGRLATDADLQRAIKIFSTLGAVNIVDETLFDAVTAVSGSGPAYFYYLMEALIDAATDEGIPEPTARELVLQTARGASLLAQGSIRTPAELRGDVATPGGCTMAALQVLEAEHVKEILRKAVRRATEVASRLGQKPSA